MITAEHQHRAVTIVDPEWLGVGAVIRVCGDCGVLMETN